MSERRITLYQVSNSPSSHQRLTNKKCCVWSGLFFRIVGQRSHIDPQILPVFNCALCYTLDFDYNLIIAI